MKSIAIFLICLFSSGSLLASEGLIAFKVLKKSEMAHYKISFDVEVPLVGNRLPNEQELGAISSHLVARERKHDRSFVLFYLPGMIPDSGAYASAHHNPDMEVVIMKYMLQQYPEYEKYAR